MENNTFVQNLSKLTNQDINNQLTWCLEIKDRDLRKDFLAYNYSNRSYSFVLCYALMFTFFFVPFETSLFQNIFVSTSFDLGYIILSIVYYINLLLVTGSAWFFVLSKHYPKILSKYDYLNTFFTCFGLTFLVIVRIYRYSFFPCQFRSLIEFGLGRNCHLHGDIQGPTWDSGMYSALLPITFSSIIRESRFILILSSFIAIIGMICYVSVVRNLHSMIPFFIWIPFCLFVIFHAHYGNIKTYFLKRKLVETLIKHENEHENNQAIEMRHMIANVAHDLKTPLSSFTSGIDIIEQVLVECEESYKQTTLTLDTCFDKFLSIGQYLEDIRNTNSFMLMTINRCIDYTKASKGMKLVPRYETIDLLETLRLPLNCMKNIQNRIQICLKPISEDICTHIMTDKQWLQENILCLLSNAVKYSSSGEVIVRAFIANAASPSQKSSTTPPTTPMKFKLVSPVHRSSLRSSLKVLPTLLSNNNLIVDESANSSPNSKVGSSSKYNSSFFDRGSHYSGSVNNQSNESITEHSAAEEITLHDTIPEEHILMLRFEVEDTGIGMTDEAMQTLFNPFKQTQRLAGGTGLGLYSLAKRVEALNGRYGVLRRRDGKQGSLFWFTIPYRPDDVSASMMKKTPGGGPALRQSIFRPNSGPLRTSISSAQFFQESIAAVNVSSLTILIADDSPSILKMTTMMLRKQGHQVFTAENGAIAVKMVEERWKETGNVFDLVLMDLQMPVMDGLEATRRIRKLEQEESPPSHLSELLASENSPTEKFDSSHSVVLFSARSRQMIVGCSANSDSETTDEAFKAGVDAFMSKPFTMDSFHVTANKLVTKLINQSASLSNR